MCKGVQGNRLQLVKTAFQVLGEGAILCLDDLDWLLCGDGKSDWTTLLLEVLDSSSSRGIFIIGYSPLSLQKSLNRDNIVTCTTGSSNSLEVTTLMRRLYRRLNLRLEFASDREQCLKELTKGFLLQCKCREMKKNRNEYRGIEFHHASQENSWVSIDRLTEVTSSGSLVELVSREEEWRFNEMGRSCSCQHDSFTFFHS